MWSAATRSGACAAGLVAELVLTLSFAFLALTIHRFGLRAPAL
jgi:hypothetical protein